MESWRSAGGAATRRPGAGLVRIPPKPDGGDVFGETEFPLEPLRLADRLVQSDEEEQSGEDDFPIHFPPPSSYKFHFRFNIPRELR